MEEFNFDTLASWLETTEQQFQVIKTIYKLESKNEESKPRDISKEYARQHNKVIQKPNLFIILKTLAQKELIQKDASSNYKINYAGIRQTLGRNQERLQKEREEFQKAYSKTEEYFKKHIQTSRPSVDYYEQNELYSELIKSIGNSSELHIFASFPNTAYTYNLASGINRLEYVEALWKKCFKEKQLEISYLTTLDVDYLFNQAFRALEEPKRAFKECEIVLQQLENQMSSHSKIKIRVADEQKGMDVCIPIRDKPAELYLFIKDEHKEILGGIKIRSPETAMQAENMFKIGFNYAEELTSKTLEKARKKLRQEYGILE